MSFRTILRGVLAALLVTWGVTVLAPPGTAHRGDVLHAVPQAAGSDPLSLNGSCEPGYWGPANSGVMTYRPRYNWNPATFQVVETPSDVWVCVHGLSRRPPSSTLNDSVTVVIDRDHNASSAPDRDDIRERSAVWLRDTVAHAALVAPMIIGPWAGWPGSRSPCPSGCRA